MRLRVVTVDITQGLEKIVLPEIKKWIPPSELIQGSWEKSWSKELRTLTLANGSFIEFLTYEQDIEKFAGTSRHGIWFDEEPPEAIYVECLLRLLDVGGHWWITMTPLDGMTWTFDRIFEANDPNIDIFVVSMDDNPHLPDESKKIILAGLDKDEKKMRKEGIYVSLGGVIYKNFDFDKHVLEPCLPPTHWLHVTGMDHGTTNPTAWLWGAIDDSGRLLIYDEYYERGLVVYEYAQAVREIDNRHISMEGVYPEYRVGDPSIVAKNPITGTSIQLEYMKWGLDIIPGVNDVTAGIDMVGRMMVQNKLFVTKNCRNLLWELKRYRWKVWEHKKTRDQKDPPQEPQKKNDHACDALRYIVASHPELDPGKGIAVRSNTIGASEAINPEEPLVDRELSSVSSPEADFHLGEEY